MKASLQLTVSQHLALTPQLQQAIRLLQLSTLELNQEIQQMIEINPLLEHDIPNDKATEDLTPEMSEQTLSSDIALSQTTLAKDLPVDTTWEIIYPNTASKHNFDDEAPNFDNVHCTIPNLQEHLLWQMELTPFSEIDRLIACAIIDSISAEGLLSTTLLDLHESINATDKYANEAISLEKIETVLKQIQQFDPPGIAAKDLSECLVLQLNQLPESTPHLKLTIDVATHYLNELATHNYKLIMQQLQIDQTVLYEIIDIIKSLNPKPGSKLLDNEIEYIIPDILVKKEEQRWIIELNSEALSRLRLNENYLQLRQPGNSNADNKYISNKLQEARWFMKSIESRNETLLNVASCIIERQQDFLNYGAEAMKPLVLSDVAKQLEMHESTISRITTQKYMLTPRGIFELKYFFSSHVSTYAGGECSSTAIRAVIKKLIAAENTQKPLSDNKIAQLLNKQGIDVARRTIAKYREAMNIACSNERKSI